MYDFNPGFVLQRLVEILTAQCATTIGPSTPPSSGRSTRRGRHHASARREPVTIPERPQDFQVIEKDPES
jgi:hypothetical protein